MSAVQLSLELEGAGWARLDVIAAGVSHSVADVSYLTDVLGDLVRVGIDIATDRGYGSARLDHEPGSTILIAETSWLEDGGWKNGARLSAFTLASDEEPSWRQMRETARDFAIELPDRDSLARLFLDLARQVADQHGGDGYSKLWSERLPYPARAVRALEAALAPA